MNKYPDMIMGRRQAVKCDDIDIKVQMYPYLTAFICVARCVVIVSLFDLYSIEVEGIRKTSENKQNDRIVHNLDESCQFL